VRRILALTLVLAGCAGCSSPSELGTRPETAPVVGSATPSPVTQLSCVSSIVTGPLPTWARAGFSPSDVAVPHVTGVSGDIVGVVFGDPLVAPPSAAHGNKILWVPRVPLHVQSAIAADNDLHIRATLNGTSTTADRTVVGGPGPSLIDLPAAGCWTMNLTWSGRTDAVAVLYHAS
jgi:hypothetical protein